MKKIIEVLNDVKDVLNIKYEILSNGWIIKVAKGNKSRYICGYKFPLNNHAIGNILDDKYALYDVLKSEGIKVIEHNILYSKENTNTYAIGHNNYNDVIKYLSNNKSIVLKSNTGTCGDEVYKIDKIEDIVPTLDKLFKSNHSISYSPFYNIKKEYRVIILNDNVEIIYGKRRPIIKGNGKDSIKNLLLKFNYNYFKGRLEGENYNKVLKNGEEYIYDWKFNLSRGSIAEEVDDNILIKQLKNMALKCTRKLNLNFVSVDIIQTVNNELLVLEINSGIMLERYPNFFDDGYEKVKRLYTKAILEMFKQ